jgi:hypothetical protein
MVRTANQDAASVCSLGWLDMKMMVVFIVMGVLYISVSKSERFLIITRSRKLMRPLFSCVGFICRFVYFVYVFVDVRVCVFFVSSSCFMCVFSMCCTNISTIMPDIGDPIETPFSGWYMLF